MYCQICGREAFVFLYEPTRNSFTLTICAECEKKLPQYGASEFWEWVNGAYGAKMQAAIEGAKRIVEKHDQPACG